MNDVTFWEIIAMLNWKAAGDDDAVIRPAAMALSTFSEGDIFHFDDILAEKLYQLDGEIFAREIGEHSYKGSSEDFSADYFLYARCAVVANGKQLFEQVLADPTRMPKDLEFEALLTLASAAFQSRTGSDNYPHVSEISYETFSNAEGWNRTD
jgi:hypothetical protein